MSDDSACDKCGHIACVCGVLADHDEDCKYRRSATCAVPIECEHGRDVCPLCDPCTCKEATKEHEHDHRTGQRRDRGV